MVISSTMACPCPAAQALHGAWAHPGGKKEAYRSLEVQAKPFLPINSVKSKAWQRQLRPNLLAEPGLEPSTYRQSPPPKTPFRCPPRSPGGGAPAVGGQPEAEVAARVLAPLPRRGPAAAAPSRRYERGRAGVRHAARSRAAWGARHRHAPRARVLRGGGAGERRGGGRRQERSGPRLRRGSVTRRAGPGGALVLRESGDWGRGEKRSMRGGGKALSGVGGEEVEERVWGRKGLGRRGNGGKRGLLAGCGSL